MKNKYSIVSLCFAVIMIFIALFTRGIAHASILEMIKYITSVVVLGADATNLMQYIITLLVHIIPIFALLIGCIMYFSKKRGYIVEIIATIVGCVIYTVRFVKYMGFAEAWEPSAFYMRLIRPFVIDTMSSMVLIVFIVLMCVGICISLKSKN